jgi:hypothetical protein
MAQDHLQEIKSIHVKDYEEKIINKDTKPCKHDKCLLRLKYFPKGQTTQEGSGYSDVYHFPHNTMTNVAK